MFRLLPRSIHVAERSILDRSDVLGPVLSLGFRHFQRFMKPGIKLLSCCLTARSALRSPRSHCSVNSDIGEAGCIYRLEHSKTQQAGVTATSTPDKPVLDQAALALQDWLEASGITEGANFRRLWKQRIGPALSAAAVGEIVQRRARLAGLDGDFGGHSLRSGSVTEAGRQGVALPAIMQLTEHRSVSSVAGYFHVGEATISPAAHLLED